MKSVLLVGQSNMAGRGFLCETKPICNERAYMLRNGRWQMMAEPIHFDRAIAGAGLAASFAEGWCNRNPKEQIGLIPCAEGGSGIDEWLPGEVLFRHAVSEARYAMENSELIAILWHQGENDSRDGKYKDYYDKLDLVVNAFRKELSAESVPFIVGGMGDYLGKSAFGAGCVEYEQINQELYRYANEHENCYFVTGKDLFSNPDGIHMNAESLRRLGLRYLEAYCTKKNIEQPLCDESALVERLYEREHTIAEQKYLALEEFTLGKITFNDIMKVLM